MKLWKRTIAIFLSTLFITAMPISANALEETAITAPSAVLMEPETGKVLFEKNAHEIRACASITKVMTLLLVFEAIDSNKLSMDETVTASAHAASMGGSDIWLEEGETMTVDEMIKATVVASANDAAVALADTIQYDANRTITRSNSRSGVFNGNYYYTINNSSVTKLCLNVYMPNESGTDYLQGTITLVGNDGTSAPVQIANYSGDSWTLTFTGVKVGVRYHFHYELYSVGSSQVGYIASAAYAQ